MKRCVAVSPHLDDAAFSCGGTLARLAREGWACTVVTVFTASVPGPRGFALACQTDKGLDPGVDYMALRRAEDTRALRALGARPEHLPFAEAPHRGYTSAADLFAGVHDDEPLDVAALTAELTRLTADADLVLAPQALGGHVDHLLVRGAVARLDAPVAWYRDTPYVLREPRAGAPEALAGLAEVGVALDLTALDARVAAATSYTTQLGFQFGGVEQAALALRAFARAEAARLGLAADGAEAFRCSTTTTALEWVDTVWTALLEEETEDPGDEDGQP